MSKPILHFYFDYLSPYAYFAWFKVRELAKKRDLSLIFHPVVFGGLLNHWEQKGPAEIPPKREWVFKDTYRYAALHQIPLKGPKVHPFNPLLALRLSLPEVTGSDQEQMIDSLWKGIWGEGINPGSEEEIRDVLKKNRFEVDLLIEKAKSPPIKELLKSETDRAIAKGVFGIPTIIIENELFWGNDRFAYIELYLDGKDPLDNQKLKEVLARPRAADRLKK